MKTSVPVALLAVLALATSAVAQWVPDLTLSTAEIPAGAVGAVVIIDPDGLGTPFTAAYAPGGAVVDATITAVLRWPDGNPAVDFPLADIWLETTGGGLSSCAGLGTHPDHATDDNGATVWQDPAWGGGCTAGEFVLVMVQGAPIVGMGLEISFRSPDLDGNLDVELTDIVLFTQMLGSQDDCADFNNDGAVNLTDITIMAQGIGKHCVPADPASR